ncbi:MAG: hypothetical protein OQK46_02640 [Gammaproteobacteria bacterium]|nr:hypothetical protein [Gammaproteobacteria bacterium]
MKRFNYTGRMRILQTDIHVSLNHHEGQLPNFSIVVDLENYGLPAESLIIIEAYQSTRWMRFSLGKVGLIQNDVKLVLSDFDDIDHLRFRVKIIEEETGKLLALANGVHPITEGEDINENQRSILPVRSTDLAAYGVCWKLDYNEDVTLLIEKCLGGKEQVVRSDIFKSLILPSAMREILNCLVKDEWDDELDDTSDWKTKWLLFVKQLGGSMPDKGKDADNIDWVDEAVRRLVDKMGNRNVFIENFEERIW